MTWNNTKNWMVGADQGTAALWNAQARDNIQYNRDTRRIAVALREGPGTVWTTTSATQDDLGGTDWVLAQLRKRQADTYLVARLRANLYSDTANTVVRLGVAINISGGPLSGKYDSRPFLFNNANDIKTVTGLVVFDPSVAVIGMYTIALSVRIVSAAGPVLSFSSGDSATMAVFESGVD